MGWLCKLLLLTLLLYYSKKSSAQEQEDKNIIFPIKIRNSYELDKLSTEDARLLREIPKSSKTPRKVEAQIRMTRIKKFDMEMRELTYEVQIDYKWKEERLESNKTSIIDSFCQMADLHTKCSNREYMDILDFSTKKPNRIKSQITQDKCCHLTSFSGIEMALFENCGDIYAST